MRLVIEERIQGHPEFEEALLAAHAGILGIPVLGVTRKPFMRGTFVPHADDVVAGSIRFVRDALRISGCDLPPQNPYPSALWPFLSRHVWRVATLGEALALPMPVFIRPAIRWKRFTGFVATTASPGDVYGVSRREPVWCSDVVTWRSEWRAYVVNGAIRFVGHAMHGGSRHYPLDLAVVEAAVAAYDGPSGYAIDFGVLSSGETALIEVNDGFSVGAYDGVPADVYWAMTANRWRELTHPRPASR